MSTVRDNDQPGRAALPLDTADLAVRELAPPAEWGATCASEHFVQFYETDDFLLNSLRDFVRAGLCVGDACIVVSKRAYREELEARLRAEGLDMTTAIAHGQYVALDAAETLAQFMLDGWPEPARFAEVVGSVVARAGAGARRVRIYGDMVAHLWAEGNQQAALRLEELWNELGKTHSFSLFCAYPMQGFGGEAQTTPLTHVCGTHSRVIPAESYTTLADPDARLRAIIQLQQQAHSLQAEITEHKETEAALRALKEELETRLAEREQLLAREQMARAEAEEASRLKDEFLATVSHELRTPLNAILGWSHMLRNNRLDAPTTTRAVETIERNAQAQAQLVEDILDVSRMIMGKLRLNIAPVDVAAVINAAVDSVQLAADTKGIRLGVTLDPSARHVAGDPGRLQQVVWNLLANAIKFTPAGGSVEVQLARAGDNAELRVSDTGGGISADFLPYIFDRFRQADGSSTRRHGGLGLGLAIVRHLVELHGGTVHVESAGQGHGATFTIQLPLAVAREGVTRRGRVTGDLQRTDAAAPRVEQLPSLAGLRVLLVDDDQDTLQVLSVLLTGYGAEVHAAASVSAALEALPWYKPDVLVSDLALPDEDGYALISKLRALADDSRHTPTIALTAYVRVEDRAHALAAGFNMFVPKPVEPNELLTAIVNLVAPDPPDVLLIHSEIG